MGVRRWYSQRTYWHWRFDLVLCCGLRPTRRQISLAPLRRQAMLAPRRATSCQSLPPTTAWMQRHWHCWQTTFRQHCCRCMLLSLRFMKVSWICSVFCRLQYESGPHHGRIFSIYLCHFDWLFHGESCPQLDVVHPGRAWLSSPACTWHCSLHYLFLQATPLFPHASASFLALTASNRSLFTPALLKTHSLVYFAVKYWSNTSLELLGHWLHFLSFFGH